MFPVSSIIPKRPNPVGRVTYHDYNKTPHSQPRPGQHENDQSQPPPQKIEAVQNGSTNQESTTLLTNGHSANGNSSLGLPYGTGNSKCATHTWSRLGVGRPTSRRNVSILYHQDHFEIWGFGLVDGGSNPNGR